MTIIPEQFRVTNNLELVRGKRVLVRVDLNIKTRGGELDDRHRLQVAKDIVKLLKPAKQIILISHLGRPKKRDRAFSLRKVLPLLPGFSFCDWRPFGSAQGRPGGKLPTNRLILLENLRFFPEEQQGNLGFAHDLSVIADIFINEAFPASHREHSSIAWLPKFLPSYFGPRFVLEIEQLNQVFAQERGLVFVLGGAKLETKLPLITRFLPRAELIALGGGVANTFLAAKGLEIGRSLYDKNLVSQIARLDRRKLLAPCDVVIERTVRGRKTVMTIPVKATAGRDVILDVGPATIDLFARELVRAQLIVWNGPLGQFEDPRFAHGTTALIKYLATLPTDLIIGGGDTLNAIASNKAQKKLESPARPGKTFFSTGGGAMLQYLADGTLPGIEAILKR